MPRSRSHRRAHPTPTRVAVTTLTGAAVAAAGLTLGAPAAQAVSASVVINEVYGAGGNTGSPTYNRDYVELYNPTGSAVSLDGTSLQYRSATGTANPSGVVALSGSIGARGYYLIGLASGGGNGAALPVTPQVSSTGVNISGTAGTLFLANQTTALTAPPTGSLVNNPAILDLVGYGTSNTYETAAASAPSSSASLTQGFDRSSADRDNNATDFTVGDLTPGSANPGSGTSSLAATNPGDKAATVGTAITGFQLQATGGSTPYSWTATGLPDGLSIAGNGTVSGTPTTAGTSSVRATVTDAAGATAATTFTYTVTTSSKTIADIQGTGASTPFSGQTVTTQGVVTAAYPTGGLNGFYLQTPGADTTPDASDGIFVYGGSSGFSSYPSVGDSVRVTGTAGEFSGQTQITATTANVTTLSGSLGQVTSKTVIPGTDCALPGGACLTGAALDAAREQVEGEAFQPSDAYTATDVYDGRPLYNDGTNTSSNFGEIGLAADSTDPLVAPTELYDAQTQGTQITDRTAYNKAHRVILDDGSSVNYSTTTGSPLPWLTKTHTTRVGAAVTFPAPVILGYGFNSWRLQPQGQVVGAPTAAQPQFAQARSADQTPADVGGDVTLATFNVLNFFPTTGQQYVASGLGTCTYYNDRAGNHITDNTCTAANGDAGPRGAADDANLTRQRDKIVAAINGSGADIVSLEELENSVKFGKDRDDAIGRLVDALNAAAGAGTWDFVPSPAASALPPVAEQDVIRTGFVYRPASVATIGSSRVLADQSDDGEAFANAREPLAQVFTQKGAPRSSAFAVVVNHFKSKGSGADDGTGQGLANPDRVAQANALVGFADQFQSDSNVTRTFLVGDFNSYSAEDPIQVLNNAGFASIDSTTRPGEETYTFDGQVGSLDHVLANPAAAAAVAGADVWEINANEPVYDEYSRYNYNVTDLYLAGPFRSSDHNPEIVGIASTARTATTTSATDVTGTQGDTVQVPVTVTPASGPDVPTGQVTLTAADGSTVGTGTLGSDGSTTIPVDTDALAAGTHTYTATYGGDDDFAGSSDTVTVTLSSATVPLNLLNINDFHGRIDANTTKFATTVEQLRAQGGDADTLFLSAGDNIGASLFASSVQQDQPTIDVLNALGLKASAIGNHEFDQGADDLRDRVEPAAQWSYLAANIYDKGTTTPAFSPYDVFTVDGVRVGVIGAITQETPSLVSPGGIADLDFGDPVDAVNRVAAQLTDGDPGNGEADVLVAEYHEGAGDSLPDDATCDQEIAQGGVFGKIATQTAASVSVIFTGHTHKTYACDGPVPGDPSRTRPILQTGSYGENVGQVVLDVDRRTHEVTSYTQRNVAQAAAQDLSYPRVQRVKEITDAALAHAAQVGNQPVGRITADITTAYLNGARDNRAAESTLGDLVANALRDGARSFADADLGITNPGGLRAELFYRGDTSSNPDNTDGVVTYAEANSVLPFNNTLTLDQLTGAQIKTILEQQWQTDSSGNIPSRPYLQLGLSDNVRVTADAANPAGSRITSVWIDGQPLDPARTYTVATVSFLAQGGDNFRAFLQGRVTDTGRIDNQVFRDYLAAAPRSPDFARQQVFATDLPASITEGARYRFTLGPDLPAPTQPNTGETLDLTSLGSPANTQVVATVGGRTVGTFPVSNGTAQIDLTVPQAPADDEVTFTAAPSGTTVTVPMVQQAASIRADEVTAELGQPVPVAVSVTRSGQGVSGSVELVEGATSLGSATLDADGAATVTIPAGTLARGAHTVRVVYSGDELNPGSETTVTVTITQATPTVTVPDVQAASGKVTRVPVQVTGAAGVPTGTVRLTRDGTQIGSARLGADDRATVTVPKGTFASGSSTEVVATYSGDDTYTPGSTTVTVSTSRVASKTTATTSPKRVVAGRSDVTLTATVVAKDDSTPTGTVEVTVSGRAPVSAALVDGRATVDLGTFDTVGDASISVVYSGDGHVQGSSTTRVVHVKAR